MLDPDTPFTKNAVSTDRSVIAAQALRTAIVGNLLAPGQKLSEVVVCRDYGIGRGSIRAAFIRLAQSGFVSSQPRSGWCVTPISAAEIREVILARRQLEPILAHLPRTGDELSRLETVVAMYEAAGAPGTAGRTVALARRYEREMRLLLLDRLNAPMVAGWLTDLWDRSDRLVNFFEARSATRMAGSNWRGLLLALRDDKPRKAAEELARMLKTLETFLNTAFLHSEAALSRPPAKPVRRRTPSHALPSDRARPNPKRTI